MFGRQDWSAQPLHLALLPRPYLWAPTAVRPGTLLRSVSVYPVAADAAWGRPYRATSDLGFQPINGTYGAGGSGNGTVVVRALAPAVPTFVLDLGARAGVAGE